MAHANGLPDALEKHQQEVCGAFARAAVAMRDAAQTAENFSNWFSRVNNLQNVPVPPMFNGYNFTSQFTGLQQQQQQPPQSAEAEQTGKKRKVSGDQEGKKKRPVKEKKPHDPNAPKRPPSAYLLFQNEVRKEVKDQHPDMPYSQVLAEISKLWHALTPEERAPYMQATADSKVIYDKAKASYDAQSPTEPKDAKEVKETKSSTSKSRVPALSSVDDKPAAKAVTTSDDDDEEEEEEGTTSSSSDKSSEEDEEDEIVEELPEPPRKKPKKDPVKGSSPLSVKVVEKTKKKGKEGKEKRKK